MGVSVGGAEACRPTRAHRVGAVVLATKRTRAGQEFTVVRLRGFRSSCVPRPPPLPLPPPCDFLSLLCAPLPLLCSALLCCVLLYPSSVFRFAADVLSFVYVAARPPSPFVASVLCLPCACVTGRIRHNSTDPGFRRLQRRYKSPGYYILRQVGALALIDDFLDIEWLVG